MAHVYLLLAFSIALEAVGTTSMKLSEGFTQLVPSLVVVVGYGGALLAYIYLATRIELGLIYAVWSGAGTVLIAVIGVLQTSVVLAVPSVITPPRFRYEPEYMNYLINPDHSDVKQVIEVGRVVDLDLDPRLHR